MTASPAHGSAADARVCDVLGIGFGPSNLALAVAAKEAQADGNALFLERAARFQWHAGMLIDGARMQISFLKDLATLRNPASPYTFLQYARAKGRLEQFINLCQFHPTRVEYHDYLEWVADAFADRVHYGVDVRAIVPVTQLGDDQPSVFRVEANRTPTGEPCVYFARNVVYAVGGKPRLHEGLTTSGDRVVHSSRFLPAFPNRFADVIAPWTFAVVGDGQSAGEVVAYLLERYEHARVHFFISGFSLRATDSSPFVNEQFYSTSADAFYRYPSDKRSAVREELRHTNYGVIQPDLIDHLYGLVYQDQVKGRQRLVLHPFSRLTAAQEDTDAAVIAVEDCFSRATRTERVDGLVLATGYERSLDAEIFADMLPLIRRDEAGAPMLSRGYRIETVRDMPCGLYVQGFAESSFGLGDTLLSLLPFRAKEILDDIRERMPAPAATPPRPSRQLTSVEYPPSRHLEDDVELLYAVMERFRFATLISSRDVDDPVVTHVPLTLDRSRGAKGVLFGHMDRANPHVDLLDGRPVLALFHGPNAYISPHVYATRQLPTWNSMTVHVRGTVRVLEDPCALVRGLTGICEHADQRPDAFRLEPSDPRIDPLLRYIVGFEIEIAELVGRFKLSQDRNESDRRRAAYELACAAPAGDRRFIERALGLSNVIDEAPSGFGREVREPVGEVT